MFLCAYYHHQQLFVFFYHAPFMNVKCDLTVTFEHF